jgi:ATP-binding cassette subfamily C (CFTR/MRP) protein 2
MLTQFLQPLLVAELVDFIKHGGSVQHGWLVATGLAVVSTGSSLSSSAMFYHLRRLSAAVNASAMYIVYEHSTKLTMTARHKHTIGQTTNLMSIDSDKLQQGAMFIHFMWHAPIAILMTTVALAINIGVFPAIAGMGFLIVMIPIQHKLAKHTALARRAMLQFTDSVHYLLLYSYFYFQTT